MPAKISGLGCRTTALHDVDNDDNNNIFNSEKRGYILYFIREFSTRIDCPSTLLDYQRLYG